MDLKFDVDDRGVTTMLSAMQVAAGNYSKPLKQFQALMVNKTAFTFDNLRLGGTYRGVTWPYFKTPRYTRKTDGVAVPPWGGVPWARNPKRRVLGQLRERGNKSSRLKNGDSILQSSRTLLRGVTTRIGYEVKDNMSITWGTRLSYAEKQNRMRAFLFFQTGGYDDFQFEQLIQSHLMGGDRGNT